MAATPTELRYTVWEITLRCDLACGHCGSRAGKARSDELDTAEALDVVRQIADMGCREVTLIGGEAYLREDWDQIAKAIRAAGMTCTMTTGGRGMTPERAQRAKDAGIQSMSVSLDGLRAAHDRQRGVQGAFDAALGALRNLRAVGIPVSVNTQINRLTVDDLEQVLELIADEGAHSWQIQFTVPMGRAADQWEWLLQPYELLDVFPRLAQLQARCKELGVRLWPGNNVGYFGPYETTLRGSVTRRGHTVGCQAGRQTLGLEADGAIKGCPSLPTADFAGGHVRARPIREVWEETAQLRFTRDQTIELWGACASCYYAETCRAGCTWTAHVFFGRAGNNPYCHHRALEYQRQGLRERFVQAAPAPGAPFDHGTFELVLEPSDAPLPTARPLPVVNGTR
ncbi:MAG: radical SAM protein [Planctomycetes bacterium]|nr:radical SAM protein [Planctomycetota bacterium]